MPQLKVCTYRLWIQSGKTNPGKAVAQAIRYYRAAPNNFIKIVEYFPKINK